MPDERSVISVRLEDGERHGRYVGRVEGIDAEGEIAFTRLGPDLISADHTNAPAELKGTGLAATMVEHLVADARARGFKVVPICPYVRARYEKHPEWRDVFTVGPGEKPKLTAAQLRE
ncbi:GNAT family N-acetyltransferase [Qipengyuania qiaonensis]|uniref:N-acetyltransferase n=1 Tax=Qipengyuania qiaonensis TaxID=2867240 RepID=A0ABS7J9V4_9SPHN|nr:GNAT family N-acetyltransferase [Qipengyuania qiaonensis]MBX7484106.1 N-acetyltransferase [Qipengyuania qiaonensis]